MNYIKLIIVGLLINSFMLYSQQPLKFKSGRKVPRVSILFTGSFGYVFSSANGTGRDFSSWYKPEGGNIFNSRNLGMQDGFGLGITGKYAVSKNKKFGLTGNLGYNHFYNSEDRGMNRTRWNIFNLGAGVEYNFTPKQKESVFIGYQLDYNLMFGAWQSDITYPDNSVSNIYTKFKPASRLGMSATAGMQFRLSKKTDMVIAIKGVWVNIFPKQNYFSGEVFYSYINDAGDSNGIELDSKKDIIYLQISAGIVLPLKY
jgi:hypothetical protein